MFSPIVAEIIGLNEAIFLNQLHYWKQRSKNERDGFIWVYKTVDEWQQEFPFWNKRTIERLIKKLQESKLLVASNYNTMKIDRTKWYRINYELLQKQLDYAFRQNDGMEPDNLSVPTQQNDGLEPAKMSDTFRQSDGMEPDNVALPITIDYSDNTSLDYLNSTCIKQLTIIEQTKTTDRDISTPSVSNIPEEEYKKSSKEKNVVGQSIFSSDESNNKEIEKESLLSAVHSSNDIDEKLKVLINSYLVAFNVEVMNESANKDMPMLIKRFGFDAVNKILLELSQLEDSDKPEEKHSVSYIFSELSKRNFKKQSSELIEF